MREEEDGVVDFGAEFGGEREVRVWGLWLLGGVFEDGPVDGEVEALCDGVAGFGGILIHRQSTCTRFQATSFTLLLLLLSVGAPRTGVVQFV